MGVTVLLGVSVGVLVVMPMIMRSMVMMVVVMVVAAAAGVIMVVCVGRRVMRLLMAVIMIVSVVVVMIMIVSTTTGRAYCMIMPMIMPTVVFFGAHGEEVEEPQDHEADSGDQHHGLKNAVRREVMDDPAGGVKVKQDAAPEKEQGDADKMGESANSVHGEGRG